MKLRSPIGVTTVYSLFERSHSLREKAKVKVLKCSVTFGQMSLVERTLIIWRRSLSAPPPPHPSPRVCVGERRRRPGGGGGGGGGEMWFVQLLLTLGQTSRDRISQRQKSRSPLMRTHRYHYQRLPLFSLDSVPPPPPPPKKKVAIGRNSIYLCVCVLL